MLPRFVWLNTVETELLPSPDSSLNSQGARRQVDLKITIRRPTCMLGAPRRAPRGWGQGGLKSAPVHANCKQTVLRDYWELSEQILHTFESGS